MRLLDTMKESAGIGLVCPCWRGGKESADDC